MGNGKWEKNKQVPPIINITFCIMFEICSRAWYVCLSNIYSSAYKSNNKGNGSPTVRDLIKKRPSADPLKVIVTITVLQYFMIVYQSQPKECAWLTILWIGRWSSFRLFWDIGGKSPCIAHHEVYIMLVDNSPAEYVSDNRHGHAGNHAWKGLLLFGFHSCNIVLSRYVESLFAFTRELHP